MTKKVHLQVPGTAGQVQGMKHLALLKPSSQLKLTSYLNALNYQDYGQVLIDDLEEF